MPQLDFVAPLSQYFFEEVSTHLEKNDICNLDDLMDLIYINENNWWKSVHLDKETANGIRRNRTSGSGIKKSHRANQAVLRSQSWNCSRYAVY